jgi:hypothetical protein
VAFIGWSSMEACKAAEEEMSNSRRRLAAYCVEVKCWALIFGEERAKRCALAKLLTKAACARA